jgi:hypothetical protein
MDPGGICGVDLATGLVALDSKHTHKICANALNPAESWLGES